MDQTLRLVKYLLLAALLTCGLTYVCTDSPAEVLEEERARTDAARDSEGDARSQRRLGGQSR